MAEIAQLNQKARKESDAALIITMRTGTAREKEQAYAQLYSEYIGYLRYFFGKSIKDPNTSEDLAIEAIGKAFTRIDKFNEKYAFSTWMQKIATNALIDFKRKQEVEVYSLEELNYSYEDSRSYLFEAEDTKCTPDEALERKDAHQDLRLKINNLKPRYKQLIEMRFLKEMSYIEIAETLGASIGTIKAQLFRAKDMLALQYED